MLGSSNSTGLGTTGKYKSFCSSTNILYDDILISKFSKFGIRKWTTYYGAYKDDVPRTLQVKDSLIYFAGITRNSTGISTAGGFGPTKYPGNNVAAFVSCIDTSGTRLKWGNYLDGNAFDQLFDFEIYQDTLIVVCGSTSSTIGFATSNATYPNSTPATSGYVGQMSISGKQLKWLSYYPYGATSGFSGLDILQDSIIAVVGREILDSTSQSNCSYGLNGDNFAALAAGIGEFGKVHWSLLVNGSGEDAFFNIKAISKDDFIFTGYSNSPGLANSSSYQNSFQGGLSDVIFGKVSDSKMSWLSYLGTNGIDFTSTMSLNDDSIFIAINTSGQGLDTINSFQPVFGGGNSDSYIALFRDTCPTLSTITLSPITGPLLVCPYDTVNYSLIPELGIGYYQWTAPPGASVVSGQGAACIRVAFDSISGPLTVMVYNSCDTLAPQSISITIAQAISKPIISVVDSSYICPNDTLIISTNLLDNLLWNTGDTTNSIAVFQPGLYAVSHIDTAGCVNVVSDSVFVFWQTPPDTPTTSVTGLYSLCWGDSVQLSTPTAAGYYWSTGDSTQSIWVNTQGQYSVQVRDSIFCYSFPSLDVTVLVDTPKTQPLLTHTGNLTFCSGDSITLQSNSSDSIVWNTGDTTQNLVVKSAGTYWCRALGEGDCPDVFSDSLTVVVLSTPSVPSITGTSTTFCQGDSLQLLSSATFHNLWSTGDTVQTIWVNQAGNYWVLGQGTNGCNSDTSLLFSVSMQSPALQPTIAASGNLTFCQGDSILLSSSYLTNNLWSTGDTTASISIKQSGAYWVSYQDTGACAHPYSDTITVSVLARPSAPSISPTGTATLCQSNGVFLNSGSVFNNRWSTGDTTQQIYVQTPGIVYLWLEDSFGCVGDSAQIEILLSSLSLGNDTTVCEGEELQFQATGGGSYQWSTGATSTSIVLTVNAPQQVWVHDVVSGCYDTLQINVLPKPQAQFTMTPSNGFTPLDVQFTNQSTGATSYSWDFGDGNQSIATNPMHTYNNLGDFTVTLIAKNVQGCSDTATYSFIEVEGGGFIYIPNTFTPNGDGRNEFFEIFGVEKPFTLMVYNRWGNQVFYSQDYQNDWDGRVNGKTIPQGAYSYLIEYKYINPNATSPDPEGSSRLIRGVVNVVQ